MNHRSCLLPATIAALVWLSTGANLAYGQSRWIPREGKNAVTVEFLRPNIESVDAGALSGAYFVTGRIATSSNFAVVGELPYARHASSQTTTDFFGSEITLQQSSSTIGNVYLGMEAAPNSSPIFMELGVRLPLVSGEEPLAQATGAVSDISRWEAFYHEVISVQAAFNVREVTPANVEYRLRLSPVLSISTEGGTGGPELFGVYSFQIGYHGRVVRLGTGASGRILVTEDSGNLGQRSLNQLDLHADFGSWGVRPGFDLHLPLDSWAEAVPVVFGASLSWSR